MSLPHAIPRPPSLLAVAAVALALAGCSDEPTGPVAVPVSQRPNALRVCCSDGGGGGGSGGGTTTNQAPVVGAIADVTTPEGSTATLTVSATDPEGGALSYYWDLDNDDDFELATGGTPSASFPVPDHGTFTYQVFAEDAQGAQTKGVGTVVGTNVAPTVDPIADQEVEAGATLTFTITATDPGAGDLTGWPAGWNVNVGGSQVVYPGAPSITYSRAFATPGVYDGWAIVTDDAGANSAQVTFKVTVVEPTNAAPTASAGGPYVGVEGSSIALSAAASTDPDAGDVLTYTWDVTGDGVYGDATGATPSVSFDDEGTYTVSVQVTDSKGATSTAAAVVTVSNAAPVIASLELPSTPVALGTSVSLAASFSDAGVNDAHTTSIDWGDGQVGNGLVDDATSPRSVSGTHSYAEPGVYTVTLTVRDEDGGSDVEIHQYVVVYDPTAGFVTGGGWIGYGIDACPVLCGGASGRGEFGFVSRYKRGAAVPTGNTRFDFHAGTLRFTSTEYEWLVVAGKRAQFKGRGTIAGAGDYGFLVTAVDGSPDAFRIRIWDRSTGVTVFDNRMGEDDAGSAATHLDRVNGNGSIVIHAK